MFYISLDTFYILVTLSSHLFTILLYVLADKAIIVFITHAP